MTMKQTTTGGCSNRLEEAGVLLRQNRIPLMQNPRTFLAQISGRDRINSERFARLEQNTEAIFPLRARVDLGSLAGSRSAKDRL